MSLCGGWTLVRHRGPYTRGITLWCRSWSCPDCAPRRRAALKRLALKGKPTKFLTLTMKDGIAGEPADHALLLSAAFRNLVKRWRRYKRGHDIQFLAVFEPTKSGRPHLHVMLRAPYTDQRWLSRQMADLLDSPIVDIRAITDRRKVARYVAKYITKSNVRFGTAKRYWCSPSYEIDKRPKEIDGVPNFSGWHVHEGSAYFVAERFRQLGYAVEMVTENEFITEPSHHPPPQWNEGRQ